MESNQDPTAVLESNNSKLFFPFLITASAIMLKMLYFTFKAVIFSLLSFSQF